MHKFLAGCFILAALSAPPAAQAAEPKTIPTPFDDDGYALAGVVTAQDCLVIGSIDLPAMVAKVSDLQSKGIIRPDADAAHVKAHAWTTASMFALKVQPIFLVTVFKNSPEISRCKFSQVVIGFDGKPAVAYDFTMTRALYDKVDWTSFTPTDLPDVTQDFSIGKVMADHMNAEAKLAE